MQSLYKGELIEVFDMHSHDVPRAVEVTSGYPKRKVVISAPHPLEFLPARDSTYYQILVETYIRTGSIVVCDEDSINIVSGNGLGEWESFPVGTSKGAAIWTYLEKLNGPQ